MEATNATSSKIPAWFLSMMAAVMAFVYMFLVGSLLEFLKLSGQNAGDWIAYISTGIMIAVACFFICRQFPASIWYVPVICNATGIFAAIIEPNFWDKSMSDMFLLGWILSIIATFAGAWFSKPGYTQAH